MARFVGAAHGFGSVEEVLSGRGIVQVHDWLGHEEGDPSRATSAEIMAALFALAEDEEAWNATALAEVYSWNGVAETTDAAFDPVRLQFEILGLSEQDVLGG